MNRPRYPDGRVHGVVVACRREDGRWLLIRRSRHVALAPRHVCFPGGGIEFGEEHAAAAIREFREELGGQITLHREVWVWEDPQRPLKLFGWYADLDSGPLTPNPQEVEEVLWLTTEEALRHPDGLPGTANFLAVLHHYLNASAPADATSPLGEQG